MKNKNAIQEELHEKQEKLKHTGYELLFSLHDNMADPEVIHNSIEAGTQIHGSNMCILIAAILIASVGLNMNSTAVIIGAMLVSPLMNGIIAMGYGIATNHIQLVKKAFSGFAVQVLICIVTSTLYFIISPISTTSSELLARTSPTVWDVVIATCGGVAGAIGITRKEKTNVIPGVAIATALMPPLCTAGYGIATGNLKYFLGAFYLFFINCFFISLSTLIVVLILKLPSKQAVDEKARKAITRSIIFIAVVTIIPSVFIAYGIVSDTVASSRCNNFINTEFDFENTQIVRSSIDNEEKTISVALIGAVISQNDIDLLEAKLNKYNLSDYRLSITQTVVPEGISPDQLQSIIKNQIDVDNNNIKALLLQEEVDRLKSELEDANYQLDEYKYSELDFEKLCTDAKEIFGEIKNCSVGLHYGCIGEREHGSDYILMTAETENPLSEETKKYIRKWLASETGYTSVELICYTSDDIRTTEETSETDESAESSKTTEG